jgi:hypothetical protein
VNGSDDVSDTGTPAKFSWTVKKKHHRRHR